MKIEGWEPRALPSQAQLDRWVDTGGRWLLKGESSSLARLVTVVGTSQEVTRGAHLEVWRPVDFEGNPAPWSEFYAATDPPVPDGWERAGEWGHSTRGAPPDVEAVLHENGNVYGRREERPDGRALLLRRPSPPVTWADVPAEVTFETFDSVTMGIGVRREGKRIGAVYELTAGRFSAHDTKQEPIPGSPFPSQPAAVVAVLRHAGVMK